MNCTDRFISSSVPYGGEIIIKNIKVRGLPNSRCGYLNAGENKIRLHGGKVFTRRENKWDQKMILLIIREPFLKISFKLE